MARKQPGTFPAKARDWKCNVFRISQPGDDVRAASALLRKVADALEQLGNVDILDVTFADEIEGSTPEMRMTVYFALLD